MIQATTERSAFAQDLCRCSRCDGLLSRYDFGFDEYGRTLERCPNCGPRVLVLRRGAPLASRVKPKPQLIKGCADCGGWMLWMGFEKPKRCEVCQKIRAKAGNIKRNKAARQRFRMAIHRTRVTA